MHRLIAFLTAAVMMGSTSGCGSSDVRPDDGENTNRAAQIVSEMTVEEKVGQLFFARYPDDSIAPNDALKYNLGGYILFAKDFKNKTAEEIRTMIDSADSANMPMLFAVDEEGGIVNRISRFSAFRNEPFKSPQELFEEGGFDKIREDTADKSRFLKSFGINVNLAPVCDVSVDENSFIYDRTFGKDAESTSEYVKTVVSQMKEENIGCALKHFPGYGDNGDTHTDVIIDNRELETFENSDFLPFKAGIAEGADIVMVSHNIVNSIDSETPASLSPEVHNILRNSLGFDGVIMTDDLSMGAVTDWENAAVIAINAGNSMICTTDYRTQYEQILSAVRNGEISKGILDSAVEKVIQLKINLGLIE